MYKKMVQNGGDFLGIGAALQDIGVVSGGSEAGTTPQVAGDVPTSEVAGDGTTLEVAGDVQSAGGKRRRRYRKRTHKKSKKHHKKSKKHHKKSKKHHKKSKKHGKSRRH
jgi:hypothetical protein